MASVHPEFGATMTRRLNQSRVSAVPQLNLIAIKVGTAETRHLNWALQDKSLYSITMKSGPLKLTVQFIQAFAFADQNLPGSGTFDLSVGPF